MPVFPEAWRKPMALSGGVVLILGAAAFLWWRKPPAAPATRAAPAARVMDWWTVVDEAGAPVPGAEVFYGMEPGPGVGRLSVLAAQRQRWAPDDAWLSKHCERMVTDHLGRVPARSSDAEVLRLARHAGRYARTRRTGPAALRLVPERPCSVHVADAAGTPVAGAAVVVRGRHSREDLVAGVTGADGWCVIRQMQRFTGPEDEWRPLRPRLGVRGLGLGAADVEFAAAAPPAEVRLRLPPCSVVAVEVRNDGVPAPLFTMLRLGAGDEELAEHVSPAGPIDFGLVACAVPELVVFAGSAAGFERRWRDPRAAGQRVVLAPEIEDLSAGGRVLIGTVLLPDRTPAADRFLDMDNQDGWALGMLGDGDGTRTDAAGRFALLFVAERNKFLHAGRECRLVEPAARPRQFQVFRAGTFTLADPLPMGTVEVGTVVLQAARTLVRGRIRVDGGELELPRLSAGRHEVVVEKDGQFVVHGVPREALVTLSASALQCTPRELHEVPVGTEDLQVLLQRETGR